MAISIYRWMRVWCMVQDSMRGRRSRKHPAERGCLLRGSPASAVRSTPGRDRPAKEVINKLFSLSVIGF